MARSAAPTCPRFEHHGNRGPVLGIEATRPRLSWTIPAAEPGWTQRAAEVEIVRGGVTRSFRLDGPDQVLVAWPDEPLAAREAAAVRVRVSDGARWSEWSPVAEVEAGLLTPEDWQAGFISPVGIAGIEAPAPVLSKDFALSGEVVSARLYATAHGIYHARINGQPVDDTVLAPGWTSYAERLRYQTYDVTNHLRSGVNHVEVLLGNGWYRGRLGWGHMRALYGDRLALLAQLEVRTADGRTHVLSSDSTWTARESHVLRDDLYDGQATDLRLLGADGPEYPVEEVSASVDVLVAPEGPAMRPVDLISATRVWASPSGRTLVDFGQNAVGWVRLRVRGMPAGHEVTVRHAEVIEDGELGTRPLRSAKATDTYLLAGAGDEVLEPLFTLHGFRYAEVTGVPDLRPEDVELVVIGSDLERTGWFESSNELVDRLHENVVWSMRGNFVDLPTDCPQRDERLGWTGDIQVFAPTASFLFDSAGFLSSWLRDLAVEQLDNGVVPHFVPDMVRTSVTQSPAAAWGDAATVVPWTIYQRTGDTEVLARQFPSMRSWVDHIAGLAGENRVWSGGFQYGDWLDPTAPPEDPFRAQTDPDLVATAHLALSSRIIAQAAAVLGDLEVAERYGRLASEVREAFAAHFVTPSGRMQSDTQTAYAMALVWDLLPDPAQRRAAGDRLADLVRGNGFRIATGFVGTPLICDALTVAGYPHLAYRLLLATGCPSWLYPVTMGATTIWERWDSMLPDGSINPGEMTSFNHYALGAVADWLHRTVAGLAPAAPGYRELTVRPVPAPQFSHAAARHLTPYGEAAVRWQRAGGRLVLDVTVPVGVRAKVYLPGTGEQTVVGHGQHHFETADPVSAGNGRTPHTDAATVRELIDDQPAWHHVVAVAGGLDLRVCDESDAAKRLARFLDAPLGRVPYALAPEDQFPAADAARATLASVVAELATR